MKRLLAILVSVALVLSMNVMVFAEGGYRDNITYTQTVNEDGTVTVTIYTSGLMDSFDLGIIYKNAEVVSYDFTDDFIDAYKCGAAVCNDVSDSGYVIFTGANSSEKYSTYAGGTVCYVTFRATEESTMQMAVDLAAYSQGGHTTVSEEVSIIPEQ